MGVAARGVSFAQDGAMLVNPNTPASGDSNSAPFKVDPNGLVYVDYTNAPGAGSSVQNGWAFSTSGQLFCTTGAITGASVVKQGIAVTGTGRVHITFTKPSPRFQVGPYTCSSTGVLYVAGPIETQAAWYQFGQGITSSAGFVSQWNDKSGNARHLKQVTATNQPALQSDGSILFDGVDNFMAADAFAFAQPITYYELLKQVTYTSGDRFSDGGPGGGAMLIVQGGVSGDVQINGGSVVGPVTMALDTYAVVAAVANGVSSSIQINNGAEATGDVGAGNPAGFTLGSSRSGAANFSHIQVKECLLYAAAHDATQRARVINYLSGLGDLGL